MKQPLFIVAALLAASAVASGQGANKPKPPVKSQDVTKGQGQQKGGDGVFKTIYTLNDGFNFTILSAKYSVDPYESYELTTPATDEKLLILTVAIKNANSQDTFFNGDNESFTAVDDKGQDYKGENYRLTSLGVKGFSPTVKPGQGYGQDPAADELTVAIKVPGSAKISKIILNQGRKFVPGEEVVRYFVAGAARKDRDGADGNPKNIIAPLPDFLRDPADPSGAMALAEGKAKLDQFVSTGYYNLRCDAFATSSTEKLNDMAPEEGKVFAIATFTARNPGSKEITLFDLTYGEETPLLKDTDGEKYQPVSDSGIRKAKRDEKADTDNKLAAGETYTYRVFFQIPKDVKTKTLLFGMQSGRHYLLDVSAAK